ncbi:ThiF family adenylyltransferase [Pseudarthrobacter enclensis]|uniref:THIF-type NAD/FAD binding fold domain-containing protein n=1 Tax=Pseudarthrobacter enclensis TaxID=993070 RepID=A0ABT9S1X5_9MICC|nr:ThiF family adenylyltransferase [Pseudarthrobacter enclensis]MDP9890519.1 hypothetical protein [Pseudarthrobacter enclensis]
MQQEVLRLQEAGYGVLKQDAPEGELWVLTVLAPAEKTGVGPLTLSITIPDSYPLLPPRVTTSDLTMGHHQHPFSKDLCLIERSTENWIPDWHLDGLLDNQLRRAVAAGQATAGQGIDEFEQGEPFSAYYSYAEPAGFLIDSAGMDLPVGASGELEASFTQSNGPAKRLLVILNQMWKGADLVYQAPKELHAAFDPYPPTTIRGRWVTLDKPPATNDAKEIWQIAREACPVFPRHNNVPLEVLAVGFPEEHGADVTGMGWILVVKEPGGFLQKKGRGKGAPTPLKSSDSHRLVRAYRAGHSDLTFRAPETHGLETKKVAVLGCGAIGSMVVEHLARAGVGEFYLLDEDTLEPGNLARHAGALDTICTDKSSAMAHRIHQINPYARSTAKKLHIGLASLIEGQTETEFLATVFNSVDVVVDATVEVGVQQYSSLLAQDLGTMWVALEGSPGIAGGSVVKIDPAAEGCFGCFQWHQNTGSIPEPPVVHGGLIQPAGCASPTFTGTGFDLSVIALQAARVIVGALMRSTVGGYPEDGYDAHILSLREPGGRPIPPTWQGFQVSRHTKCGNHEVA